jgi:hypothetical protein
VHGEVEGLSRLVSSRSADDELRHDLRLPSVVLARLRVSAACNSNDQIEAGNHDHVLTAVAGGIVVAINVAAVLSAVGCAMRTHTRGPCRKVAVV